MSVSHRSFCRLQYVRGKKRKEKKKAVEWSLARSGASDYGAGMFIGSRVQCGFCPTCTYMYMYTGGEFLPIVN